MSTSGIYLIINLVNNKLYAGSAIDFDDRWRLHRLELNRNNHHNRHLQAAWNKYGEDNFKFYVIEYTSAYNLEEREQHWIERLKATDHSIGYNICKAGRNRDGVKASEETRKRLSESHKGHKQSEETKAKRRLIMAGNQFNKGRKHSAEEIAKRVKANTGKKRSAEGRANMSAAQRGRVLSEEAKKNMSIAAKKRWKSLDIETMWAHSLI